MKKLLLPIALFAVIGCINAQPIRYDATTAGIFYPGGAPYSPGAYTVDRFAGELLPVSETGGPAQVVITGATLNKRGL